MKYILAFLFFYTLGAQAGNSSLIQNDSTNFVNKATEGIPKLLYAFMEDYNEMGWEIISKIKKES